MEKLLQSSPTLLAEKVVELEVKVQLILNFLKIPPTTNFNKSNSTNQTIYLIIYHHYLIIILKIVLIDSKNKTTVKTTFFVDFEGASSASSANTKDPSPLRRRYPRSVAKLKTGHDIQDLCIKPEPEVGHKQEWVGGGQGDFQCQVCGIRYSTKLKLDYHKMKLKHRCARPQHQLMYTGHDPQIPFPFTTPNKSFHFLDMFPFRINLRSLHMITFNPPLVPFRM